MEIDLKVCSKCGGDPKPLSEFHKRKGVRDGYRNECKVCSSIKNKAYRKENREQILAQKKVHSRAYYEANKDGILTHQKAYYEANREQKRADSRIYAKLNREKTAAKRAKRRASEQQATPKWFLTEKAEIEDMYRRSKALNSMGVDVHVDHIVPLNGKLVCGLHTLVNLQLLLAGDNLSKSNRF